MCPNNIISYFKKEMKYVLYIEYAYMLLMMMINKNIRKYK